jgi:lantibiotic modifying enzyme
MEKNIDGIIQILGHDLNICRINNIEYIYDSGEAIITLSSDEFIQFRENGFREHLAFNKIVETINKNLSEEEKLYIQPIVSLDDYSFFKIIGNKFKPNNKFNPSYYFKCGEILTLVYILGGQKKFKYMLTCINGEPVIQNISDIIMNNNNLSSFQSAEDVVRFVIEYSVFNINLLESKSEYLNEKQLLEYKSGFKRVYSILVENKAIFVKLMSELFSYKNSYLAKVVMNVNYLNKRDLVRQLDIIDAKFCNIKKDIFELSISKKCKKDEVDLKQVLKVASRLGENIIQDSIIGYNNNLTSRSWITLKKGRNERLMVCPSNDNPYEGNSGIALFFLYLGVVSNNDYFITTSVEAMESFLDNLKSKIKENIISKDFFMLANLGIYTFSRIYLITREVIIREYIEEIIVLISRYIASYDDMNLLKSFCALLEVAESEEFSYLKEEILDICNIVYEKLENKVNIDMLGRNELVYIDAAMMFCIRFSSVNKTKKVNNIIDKLLNHQRKYNTVFHIRQSLRSTKFILEMLLSRLILKKYGYTDDLIDEEVKLLVKYFTDNSFEQAIDYYDGTIITLEILEFAAESLGDKGLDNSCKHIFNKLVTYIERIYVDENVSYIGKQVSLISGLIGAGYTLIRHYCKSQVPSILWFI